MERDHLEDLDIYGMIILKCIFKNWVEEAGRDYSCSGKVGGR